MTSGSMDYREVVEHVRLPSRQRTSGTETGDPFSFNLQSNLKTIKDTPYFLMYGPEYDLSKPQVLKDYSHIFPSGDDPGTGAKQFLFSYIDEILDRQEPMQNYDKLGKVIINVDKEANTLPDFIPCDHWKGPMENYYFGRNYNPLQGIGYHRDKMREFYEGRSDDDSIVRHFEDCSFMEQIQHPSLDSIKLVSMIAREDAIYPKKMDKHPTEFKFQIKDIFERLKRNDGSFTRLRLSGENIDDVLIAYLSGAFANNKFLQQLLLHDNSITDKGIEALCMGLRWHPTIHTLWLGNNMFTDVGVAHLMTLLRRNPCIKDLNISNRFPMKTWSEKEQRIDVHPHITQVGAAAIAQQLVTGKCSLTNLNLSDQRTLDQGANQIFLSLGYSTIRSLNLKKNKLSDDCCRILGNVLMNKLNRQKPNANYEIRLEKLDLSCNQITALGVSLLADGLSINVSLRALNLSNNDINDEGMSKMYDIVQKNTALIVLGTSHNPSKDTRADDFIIKRRESLEGKRFLTHEEEYFRRLGFDEGKKNKNLLLKMSKTGQDLSKNNPLWETMGRQLFSAGGGFSENNLGELNDFGRRVYTRAIDSRALNALVVTPQDYGPFRDDYNFLVARQSSADFGLRAKSRQAAATAAAESIASIANGRINTATTRNDGLGTGGLHGLFSERENLRTAGGGQLKIVSEDGLFDDFDSSSFSDKAASVAAERNAGNSLYTPIKINNSDSSSNENDLDKIAYDALANFLTEPSRQNSPDNFSRSKNAFSPFNSSSSSSRLGTMYPLKTSKQKGEGGEDNLDLMDDLIDDLDVARKETAYPFQQSRMTSDSSYTRESKDLGNILGIPYTGSYGSVPIRSATTRFRDSGQNLMYLRISTPLDKPGSRPVSFMQISKDRDEFRRNLIDSRKDNDEYWKKKRDRLEERPTAGKQMAAMRDPPQWFWDLLDQGQRRKYKTGIDRAPGVSSISTLAEMKKDYLMENNLKTVNISTMCNNVKGETRADRNMLKEETSDAMFIGFGSSSSAKKQEQNKGGGKKPGSPTGSLKKIKSIPDDNNNCKRNNNGNNNKNEEISERNRLGHANMAILDKEQRKPREAMDVSKDPAVFARELMGISKDEDFGKMMNKQGLTSVRNVDRLEKEILPKVIKNPG